MRCSLTNRRREVIIDNGNLRRCYHQRLPKIEKRCHRGREGTIESYCHHSRCEQYVATGHHHEGREHSYFLRKILRQGTLLSNTNYREKECLVMSRKTHHRKISLSCINSRREDLVTTLYTKVMLNQYNLWFTFLPIYYFFKKIGCLSKNLITRVSLAKRENF